MTHKYEVESIVREAVNKALAWVGKQLAKRDDRIEALERKVEGLRSELDQHIDGGYR